MTKFTARALTSCVPICRSELFDDVTHSNSTYPVHNVWIVPGHVFVTVGNGHKLITFDCKPVIHQHTTGSSTLDFSALKPSVLDIFISPLSPNVAYIVQENGHVHSWQFSSYQWSCLGEFDLCDADSVDAEVVSVCLHPKHHAFYWCECTFGQGVTYRICCKILPSDTQSSSSEVIVENCPASDLLPLDSGLLIVPRFQEYQTRVCIFWQPSVLELVSVTTVIGSSVKQHHDMRGPLVFSDVVLNCLDDLSKASPCGTDLGAKKDLISGKAVLLHRDGTVLLFESKESGMKLSVMVNTFRIAMPDQLLMEDKPSCTWNVHKNVIAIATSMNTVRLHSATEGHLIHELELDAGVSVKRLACVRSPTVLVAMVTSSGVTVVQGGKTTKKTTNQEVLPSDKHFQTDALQVALLAQQREKNPSQQVSEQLLALHDKWTDLQAHQPRSQLSDTVDAYLAEFWRLEEKASSLGKVQVGPPPSAHNTNEMVQEAVSRSRGMSGEAAMAELMWLSQKYPTEMLFVLLGDLDIAKEELTAEDQALWQSTLGLESADGHSHNSFTFELVCRLLFQERPEALVLFVSNAQAVSEQTVGVSAFVRRKHMLQYYMRAMECLPEPNHSRHPQKAASAKAQIILKGATDHGPELALRFLLRHTQWSEAITLLRNLGSSAPQHSSLFSLLLQHLLQAHALSDYASEVFSLLPSWRSFLPAVKVMGDHSASQHTADSSGLFYAGSPDIPLSALRPHLMSLLSAHKT